MTIQVFPFASELRSRSRQEKIDEEVYRSIPALNDMANAVLGLSTKLSLDARQALFFSDLAADEKLRRVAVELGVERRLAMEGAIPDQAYLAGQAKTPHQAFDTAEPDDWLPKPDGPSA